MRNLRSRVPPSNSSQFVSFAQIHVPNYYSSRCALRESHGAGKQQFFLSSLSTLPAAPTDYLAPSRSHGPFPAHADLRVLFHQSTVKKTSKKKTWFTSLLLSEQGRLTMAQRKLVGDEYFLSTLVPADHAVRTTKACLHWCPELYHADNNDVVVWTAEYVRSMIGQPVYERRKESAEEQSGCGKPANSECAEDLLFANPLLFSSTGSQPSQGSNHLHKDFLSLPAATLHPPSRPLKVNTDEHAKTEKVVGGGKLRDYVYI
jgi:hypothetical protein